MSDRESRRTPGGKLVIGGEVVWTNPPDLGHAGIKLRKQIREESFAARASVIGLLEEIEKTTYSDPRELKAKLLETKEFLIKYLRKRQPCEFQRKLLVRYYAQVDRLRDLPTGMKIDTDHLVITIKDLS